MPMMPFLPPTPVIARFGRLSLLVSQDIRVTGVEDGEGRASVELADSGAELNLKGEKSQPNGPSKVLTDFFAGNRHKHCSLS